MDTEIIILIVAGLIFFSIVFLIGAFANGGDEDDF